MIAGKFAFAVLEDMPQMILQMLISLTTGQTMTLVQAYSPFMSLYFALTKLDSHEKIVLEKHLKCTFGTIYIVSTLALLYASYRIFASFFAFGSDYPWKFGHEQVPRPGLGA